MAAYIIKYSIYFNKTELFQKGEIKFKDGVSFRDLEKRVIFIVDSDDAVNYVRYLYEKNITNLIKVPQKISDDDADIDFTNNDTKSVIESISTK